MVYAESCRRKSPALRALIIADLSLDSFARCLAHGATQAIPACTGFSAGAPGLNQRCCRASTRWDSTGSRQASEH